MKPKTTHVATAELKSGTLDDSDLLRRLQDRYDQIAAADPTARHLQTTRRTPHELADRIIAMLPALTVSG